MPLAEFFGYCTCYWIGKKGRWLAYLGTGQAPKASDWLFWVQNQLQGPDWLFWIQDWLQRPLPSFFGYQTSSQGLWFAFFTTGPAPKVSGWLFWVRDQPQWPLANFFGHCTGPKGLWLAFWLLDLL